MNFAHPDALKTHPRRPLPGAAGEPLQVTRERLTWRVALWLDVSSKTAVSDSRGLE